ncbi:MAG TPA: glycosyltransferase family 4 protein [Solirubrobacteraceae bacterium]|nr:glycosyltransferase family 4 protein [Solirubrobacteraceae bacterium]
MTRSVVIVVHEPGVGGASNAVIRAIPHLAQAGWRFRFWAPTPSPVADLLRRRGYEVAGRPRPLRYSWSALAEPPGRLRRIAALPGYLAEFRDFIARTKPDLVHANTIVTLPEALAARTTGAATLLHVHEMIPPDARGMIAARLARLLDGVAAVSEANAGPLRRHGVAPRVVTAGIAPPPPSAASTEAPWPRAPARAVVGTLATVSERKGSDLFVSAASAILRERDDVEFRMVGPLAGGREEEWAREIRARAERAGVRCYAASDVDSELREWDLFVLPTRRDPFPLAILEAMAAGVPVVASRVDGVPELVDAASGVLVTPEDPEALRSAVAPLLDDPPRRAAMGRAGAARAAELFTPERHACELVDAYEAALEAARNRAPRAGREFTSRR